MKTILWIDNNERLLDASLEVFLQYEVEILKAVNTTQALRILRERSLDGVLLDVKLSNGENGLELLQEILSLYPELRVAIFTGYPDFYSDQIIALERGAACYLPKVKKSIPVTPEKQQSFFSALHKIFENKSRNIYPHITAPSKFMSNDLNEQTHVVIITALAKEKDAIIRHLDDVKTIKTKGRVFYRATVPAKITDEHYNVVLLSLAGMGNANAAVATTQAIDIWNPQVIIISGIAGGIKGKDDLRLGDVLVAEQVVSYEQAKVTDHEAKRRFDVLRPSNELLETARNIYPQDWTYSILQPRPDSSKGRVLPKVHFGIVASGEKVIAGSDLIPSLQNSWSRLIGVEMEGYGTALAAYQAETVPGVLLIKAVCDWATSSKNDKWQEYAADVAATFTIALLQEHPFKTITKIQAVRKNGVKYKGTSKIALCRRLGEEWYDLADYFDIPLPHRKRFLSGRECQGIWEWLEQRDKLEGLSDGLIFIERDDLVKVLELL